MVMMNHKPIIDTRNIKIKKSKYNTKERYHCMRRAREERTKNYKIKNKRIRWQ